MKPLKITKQITTRTSESFNQYLKDVNKIPLITREEEEELAKKAFNGDEKALNSLVTANLRFVISVAKQYNYDNVKLEDLVCEGNHGLILAAKRFDPKSGNKFISYAVWWVRRLILDYLSNNSRTIRLPNNKINDISKIKKEIDKLEQTYERLPSVDEISEALNGVFTPEQIDFTLDISNDKITSLDKPYEEDFVLLDVVENKNTKSPDHLLDEDDLTDTINDLLNFLTYQQKEAIMYLYGLTGEKPMTLNEVGEKLGVSRERIRQLKDKSLKIMRVKSRKYGLSNIFEYIDE